MNMMFYVNMVMLLILRFREVDLRYLVFIVYVFVNFNKIYYIDIFYGCFLILFIKIKVMNKIID